MRGRRITAVLYSGTTDECGRCPEVASLIRRDLGAIGIDVRVEVFPDRVQAAVGAGTKWDLVVYTWFMDFADPADFVNTLLDPASLTDFGPPFPLWRTPGRAWPAKIRAAYATAGARRGDAYRRLVRAMFRTAPPMAVYGLQNGPAQLFSGRVGCKVFRPQDQGFVDLAALCLRGKG